MKPSRARGMALISAIFMIVVLVALGAAMVALSQVQQSTTTRALLSAKVYYAAKAGLEWGVQQAIAANNTTLCPSGGAQGSVGPFTVDGTSVTVTCIRRTFGGTNYVFDLASAATVGTLGNIDFAERHVKATVSNIP